MELCEDDSWVIVKKQRVTILIPPLSSSTNQSKSPNPNPNKINSSLICSVVDEHEQIVSLPSNFFTEIAEKKLPRPEFPKKLKRCSLHDGCLLINQKMRASNLERKIQRAGGLNQWLVSLGLEKFAVMFEKKSVGKFQMMNLTMKKLKDMGAAPVGPRRKLMHAIDCMSHP